MHTIVVEARRNHRHRTRNGQHLALVVVPIADHQTSAVLIELIGERLDIGGDLCLRRCRQHLASTIANDRIEQRSTVSTANLVT